MVVRSASSASALTRSVDRRHPAAVYRRSPAPVGRSTSGALLSCRDRATGRDPPARGPERLPARAGGQARGRRRSATDLVRPARPGTARPRLARRDRAGRRLARPRRGGRRLDPAAAPGARRGSQRAGRPPLVGPGALDRHVPVDRRGAGAHADRGRPRARRARRLPVADRPADRRPGAAPGALDRADRGGPDVTADVDPRRRPARAGRSRSRARTASRR